jgi:hypothetical protein
MSRLSEAASDYCAAEHFFFLDTALKEHAGALLAHWCQSVGDEVSAASVERSLEQMTRLDLPLEIRQGVPHLLKEFFEYLESKAGFPEAGQWSAYVAQAEAGYQAGFRQDGSVKGQTVRKKFADVGRNNPCPCGSGLKFKKCCIQLLS